MYIYTCIYIYNICDVHYTIEHQLLLDHVITESLKLWVVWQKAVKLCVAALIMVEWPQEQQVQEKEEKQRTAERTEPSILLVADDFHQLIQL